MDGGREGEREELTDGVASTGCVYSVYVRAREGERGYGVELVHEECELPRNW